MGNNEIDTQNPNYMLLAAMLAEELVSSSPDPDSALHGIRCYVERREDDPMAVDDCHSPDIARTVIRELETGQHRIYMESQEGGEEVKSHFYAGLRHVIE